MSESDLPLAVRKGLAFRRRLSAGGHVVGAWSTLGSPHAAYLMARAGLDFIVIDLEHGVAGEDCVLAQVYALQALPTAVIVRLADHRMATVARVLDAGANGILCPMVNSPQAACTLVAGALFPPLGSRGVAVGAVAASDFGYLGAEYFASANDATTILVQIESAAAVDAIESIAAVPQVHGVFVGPMDLSSNLGVFRRFEDSRFVGAMAAIESSRRPPGCFLGTITHGSRTASELHRSGYQFVIAASDQGMLREGAARLIEKS